MNETLFTSSAAVRFVAALSLASTSAARGCTLGARPICYNEPNTVASIAPPWLDAGEDASVARPPPRMHCHYPIGGPMQPPELALFETRC
jgi:hypothetical protein